MIETIRKLRRPTAQNYAVERTWWASTGDEILPVPARSGASKNRQLSNIPGKA